jgi:RNA polymerase sigma-32 factor
MTPNALPSKGSSRSPGPDSGYLASISRFPILEQDHEEQLCYRWTTYKDKAAGEVLLTSHLRLAAKIARQYRGYGFSAGDLIAEANLGLVKALDHFDPSRGARFSTCATWWIKSALYDYVLRSWSLVRLGRTPAQKKLFFRLRRETRRLQASSGGPMSEDLAKQISRSLRVSVDEVIEAVGRLRGDVSLNVAPDSAQEFQAAMVDDAPSAEVSLALGQEQALKRNALKEAILELDPRERHIFVARHLRDDPETFEAIGNALRISAVRVRQIGDRAYMKVAKAARRRCK